MPLLDARTSLDLTKLMVFILVTTLATAVLVVTIGNLTFGATRAYKAEFVNATGVVKGDDIRVAGVKVGVVKDIEIVDRTRALVSFTVDEDTAVTGGTFATIKYRNLVGQRYIALTQQIGDTGRLPDRATIPVDRTKPALDLTVLFNGFKPLFQALSPTDINKLSYEIVQVFQGESGTLEGLLQHTASVTSTLADRDQVISDLIVNLNEVLDHVGDRDEQLSRLIELVPHPRRRPQGRPAGDPGVARRDLRPVGRDLRPAVGHPQALRQGHQAPARRRRQHRQEQGRAGPGAAGAADQAGEGRPDRDLRLVVQLLPLRVPGPRQAARQPRRAGVLPARLRSV